jgi:glucose-6-phosphate 1-dehydrogenase
MGANKMGKSIQVEPTVIVIFGAGGDLTQRKLLPALYNLYLDNWLPDQLAVIGVDLKPMSDDEFRRHIRLCPQAYLYLRRLHRSKNLH